MFQIGEVILEFRNGHPNWGRQIYGAFWGRNDLIGGQLLNVEMPRPGRGGPSPGVKYLFFA
jgi:hypothetical protein